MNPDTLRRRIGQLFIMGFPGEKPPTPFLSFITEENIGGVILFADNCVTHQAVRLTIETLKSRLQRTPPFIGIDQEGGRVCRLKEAPVEYRAAVEYGKGSVERFVEEYSRAAMYMESLGINLNLAPVADIFLDKNNSCLKDRCFSDDPSTVARFVEASVKVSGSHGLMSCLKHFPGLGAAVNDPHSQTAVADYDEMIWQLREQVPFLAGVVAGADMIMTTHVLVPALDHNIVTGSEKIIRELIRGLLAFDGPIITDDLTMGGASALGDIGERTVAAFNAGHDLLLFGQDFETAFRAYDFFVDAVRRGDVPQERIKASLDRVSGIKFKLGRSVIQ
jgi:beta-N-acetylhexosaminidase